MVFEINNQLKHKKKKIKRKRKKMAAPADVCPGGLFIFLLIITFYSFRFSEGIIKTTTAVCSNEIVGE